MEYTVDAWYTVQCMSIHPSWTFPHIVVLQLGTKWTSQHLMAWSYNRRALVKFKKKRNQETKKATTTMLHYVDSVLRLIISIGLLPNSALCQTRLKVHFWFDQTRGPFPTYLCLYNAIKFILCYVVSYSVMLGCGMLCCVMC